MTGRDRKAAALSVLHESGLLRFQALEAEAVSAVTDRFFLTLGSSYAQFGTRGRAACRHDLEFHLEFLKPVLEFGLLMPMVDYLCWLASVLAARSIPVDHLALSLDWLGEFFLARMEPVDGAIVHDALEAARIQFLATLDAPPAAASCHPDADATALKAALLAGDHRQALAVVDNCLDRGRSLVDVEVHVMQPAMYLIGRLWQDNQVSVAQEHIATAIVQSIMTAALLRTKPPPPNGKRVLLACVAGNHHSIGLRMVADSFQLAGWDVQYLGPDVPTASLIQQIERWPPDLVGLGLSFAQQLQVVKEIIGELKTRLGPRRPPVIIGGRAINRFERLTEMVGADAGSADAETAVRVAARLLGKAGTPMADRPPRDAKPSVPSH